MKKTFLLLSAVALSAACVFSSCQKDGSNKGGLKGEGEKEDTNLPESLKGSAYAVISMDDNSYKAIEKKVLTDLRVDDTSRSLYVWSDTYVGGTSSGLNFYGEASEWISLIVTTAGWSGAGFNIHDDAPASAFVKDAADLANWKFHFAYKGAENLAQAGIIAWNGKEYKFSFGGASFVDNGVTYPLVKPLSGEFVPNEWNEYEIALTETGIDFTVDGKGNYFSFLSGGVQGTTLDLDAVFFYKK